LTFRGQGGADADCLKVAVNAVANEIETAGAEATFFKYETHFAHQLADVPLDCFEQHFSIDVGHGFGSKGDKIKWISLFNTLRNNWAHEGTKEKGLNKSDVDFLSKVHSMLGL